MSNAGQQTEKPLSRSPNYKIIFANASRLRVGQTDLALTFGYTDAIPVAGTPMHSTSMDFTEDLATIVLTPHHAKLLALSLQGGVNAYEQEYGKIDISPKPAVSVDKISAAVKEMVEQGQ